MFTALRRIAWLALTGALLAGSALAQSFPEDAWFKLKVSAKGYSVRDDASTPKKVQGTFTMYVHMYPAPLVAPPADAPTLPSTYYAFDFWTQVGPGQWVESYGGTDYIESTDGSYFFISDYNCFLTAEDGASMSCWMTAMLKVKRGKDGSIKSATFTSLGAEIYNGTMPDGSGIRGGVKVVGRMIKPSKLPFDYQS